MHALRVPLWMIDWSWRVSDALRAAVLSSSCFFLAASASALGDSPLAAKRKGLVDNALSGVCFTDGYSRNCLTTFSVCLIMSCIALMPPGPLVMNVLMV